MLTARRMRERQEREAAGLPEPPPPRPDSIPTHEHDRIVRELNKQHSAELSRLGGEATSERSSERIDLERQLIDQAGEIGGPDVILKTLGAGIAALSDDELLELAEVFEDISSGFRAQRERFEELEAKNEELHKSLAAAEEAQKVALQSAQKSTDEKPMYKPTDEKVTEPKLAGEKTDAPPTPPAKPANKPRSSRD